MRSAQPGLNISAYAISINLILALLKITTGLVGSSYALIADGIESTADIFSSLIVWGGLRLSTLPPDEDHPYGHGKAESLAALLVSLFLLASAVLIAVQSIREILAPHHTPAWYTLLVLGLIIVTKEALFRRMFQVGKDLESSVVKSDAWHHRSDAITSLAAFLGIAIAFIGGPGYEAADDWAALLACGLIIYNGLRISRPALGELMDAAVPIEIENRIRAAAAEVEGVLAVEKCRVRKSGLGFLVDVHLTVDGDITVHQGHRIGHAVKDRLHASQIPIIDVLTHIEPDHLQHP